MFNVSSLVALILVMLGFLVGISFNGNRQQPVCPCGAGCQCTPSDSCGCITKIGQLPINTEVEM